jgi:glycosyltransferase involved in cell wall biosynthesis
MPNTLTKHLDSLLAQTFKGWEVIVIDDTEREGIADLFELRNYPFVHFFSSHLKQNFYFPQRCGER